MKTTLAYLGASSLALLACGSSQTASATRTTSAALTVEADGEPAGPTTAEKWAEEKVLADAKLAGGGARASGGGDPLAVDGALEDASIPKIERASAKELRAKGRSDLDAGMALVKSSSSVDDAVKKLTVRLGKPTWTENGARRIWVAAAGAQCHRLVLEADGSVEIETASKSEWRLLAATAKQNPCSGEIKRGIDK